MKSPVVMQRSHHKQSGVRLDMVRCRAHGARPIVFVALVTSTVTACGMSLSQGVSSIHGTTSVQSGVEDVPHVPAPAPTQAFPVDSAGIGRASGEVRTSATISAPHPQLAVQPLQEHPFEEPDSTPPIERIDLLPTGKPIASNPAPLPSPAVDSGGDPAPWMVGAGLVGALVLWRHRRGRQCSRRCEAQEPIGENGVELIYPHWEYDPGPLDSDDFLRRWDSVGLSISGEWALLLAIAGRIAPIGAQSMGRRQAGSHARSWMSLRPDWRYRPFAGDAQEHLDRWCRLGLIVHGDPLLASMAGGQFAWLFGVDAEAAVPAEQGSLQLSPVLEDPIPPQASTQEDSVETTPISVVASSGDLSAAPPPEELGGTAWLSRIAPLLRACEGTAASEAEQQLWEVSHRLRAHAEALPAIARTPWLDAVEALAERMAHGAFETSRGAWRAHWVDLRLARLGAMNGAWRLLELRALHDACAHDDAPEVLAARVRLLHAWADALLGPAAKAKRMEAAALAVSLRDGLAATA